MNNLSLNDLFLKRDEIKSKISNLEKELNGVNSELELRLASKANKFGVSNIEEDGLKIKITKPRIVDWDQKELEKIWEDIQSIGKNPRDFIKVELSVSETVYKNLPLQAQEVVSMARTEKTGKVKIELIEEK